MGVISIVIGIINQLITGGGGHHLVGFQPSNRGNMGVSIVQGVPKIDVFC